MKTIKLCIVCSMVLFTMNVFSQNTNVVVSPWIGVGGTLTGESLETPSLGGNLEFFLDESLSLGIIAGYGTAKPKVSFSQDDGATSGFIAGGLFNYYWTDSDDKFHFYTGLSFGYASHDAPFLDSRFFYEVHAGARYWISKNFGLNAEVGYGFALVKAGISIGL